MTDPSLGKQTPLVVVRKKRRKRAHRGGHAGAWKIAYADFVTAMMAFFLLMWLMMSTNHGTLEGIAEFFNRPLQSLFTQGPGVDQNLPQTNTQQEKEEDEAQEQDDHRRVPQSLREEKAALVQRNPQLQALKS